MGKPFAEMFARQFILIWDYGKDDRIIQNEMQRLFSPLKTVTKEPVVMKLLHQIDTKVACSNS